MSDNPQPSETNPIDETASERLVIPVGMLDAILEQIAALEKRVIALENHKHFQARSGYYTSQPKAGFEQTPDWGE